MAVYIIVFFFSFLVLFIKNNKIAICVILLFVLLVLSAFRGDKVGTDTINYINMLSSYGVKGFSLSDDNHGLEFIWNFFYLIIYSFSLDNSFIIIVSSFFTILFLYLSISRVSKNASFSVFIYFALFFSISLNAARQMLAVSILLYAYTYLINNQKKQYLLFLLIATFIHFSSIIYLLCIPFLQVRFSKKTNLVLIVVTFLIYLTGFNDLSKLSLYFPFFSVYFDLLRPDSAELSMMGKVYILLLNILYFTSISFFDKVENWKLNQLFVLFVVLSNVLAGYHIYINRIIYGIAIIQILYYSNNLFTLKSLQLKCILLTLIMILFSFSFFQSLSRNYNEIVPYEFRNY